MGEEAGEGAGNTFITLGTCTTQALKPHCGGGRGERPVKRSADGKGDGWVKKRGKGLVNTSMAFSTCTTRVLKPRCKGLQG